MSSVNVTSVAGFNNAVSRINSSANKIANQFSPENTQPESDASPAGSLPVSTVDTAKELINTNIASYDAQANLKVIKVNQELEQSVLDIIG